MDKAITTTSQNPTGAAGLPPFQVSSFYSYYVLILLWLGALFHLLDLQVVGQKQKEV